MASTHRWKIKDGLGNVVNTIIADESFVKQHYSNYEMFVPIIQEQDPERVAKLWRNTELRKTDEDLRQLVETRIKMTRQKLDNQNLQKLLKKRIEVTRSILNINNTTQ